MAITDLYNAEFMDHVAHPDYKYEMEDPTCSHEGVNPSCGDELTFSIRLADDGTIVNLADMQPNDTASHCSAKPVRYVLEMNQGWFAQKKLKAGFKLGGTPFTVK